MKLSIIIPCYNEISTIEKIVEKIKKNYKDIHEIIIVDDFSTDGTRQKIKNLNVDRVIYNDSNYGKGFSIRKGIEQASGNIILIQDADLEYEPQDYYKLIAPIKEGSADVVYGSRFIGSSQKRVLFFWHRVFNYFLTLLSNMFTDLNLTDMECGYKLFKHYVIKNINLEENRFGFEPEITAKISKLDIKIYEVGVQYHGRDYSQGKKITWKDGIAAVYCIFKYNLFK
jgi:glycosyltransferase involved in cell wall biosynthesis